MPDLLAPLRLLVGVVLARCHDLLDPLGLPSGAAWLLAVVALVVLVRVLLLPLAVQQARSARRVRSLAPELRRIRERYRGRTDSASRAAEAHETVDLYRAHGVRPLGSSAPVLLQLPVFLALVQALEQAAHGSGGAALASFAAAAVLGAPLAATALGTGWPGALVGIGLLLVTAAAQALTQHLGGAPGWFLVLPLVTAATGLAFPIGVTAYWCASALWTLAQQVVLLRLLRVA